MTHIKECPNPACKADWTLPQAISFWTYAADGYGGHVNADQEDPEGLEFSIDEPGSGKAIHIETVECRGCARQYSFEDVGMGLWLVTTPPVPDPVIECPVCGCDDLGYSSFDFENYLIFQDVHCMKCDASGVDRYLFYESEWEEQA